MSRLIVDGGGAGGQSGGFVTVPSTLASAGLIALQGGTGGTTAGQAGGKGTQFLLEGTLSNTGTIRVTRQQLRGQWRRRHVDRSGHTDRFRAADGCAQSGSQQRRPAHCSALRQPLVRVGAPVSAASPRCVVRRRAGGRRRYGGVGLTDYSPPPPRGDGENETYAAHSAHFPHAPIAAWRLAMLGVSTVNTSRRIAASGSASYTDRAPHTSTKRSTAHCTWCCA